MTQSIFLTIRFRSVRNTTFVRWKKIQIDADVYRIFKYYRNLNSITACF